MGQNNIVRWAIERLRVSPENDQLYHPVTPDDPEIQAMAESVKANGVTEPIVVTKDAYVLSGHRRLAAAKLAGLKSVPVRVHRMCRARQPDKFLRLLREFNRQRKKTRDEELREEIVSCDPNEAYSSLLEYREHRAEISIKTPVDLREEKIRAEISKAKGPFLNAIKEVIHDLRDHWPLSVRQIHYKLLNNPPLKHAAKPGSVYQNDRASYQSLDELTVRARLTYAIPPEAIDDETRPQVSWDAYNSVQPFLRRELKNFLLGYRRNLMQSQPSHIEIVAEKLTVQSTIRPVAERFCIPYTIGRGFANLPVRQQLADRFYESGKKNLLLLFLADQDPDGEEIVHSFARSMRDDFDVSSVIAIKVALTAEQVTEFGLPADNLTKAKKTSPNYARFAEKFGQSAYELEAATPKQLQSALEEAIASVIDHDALDAEIEAEKKDAAFLAGVSTKVRQTLANLDLGKK